MATSPVNVGRYALGERIASGGMATVHLGRLVGSAGFSRTVAIKRLHRHFCTDPAFAAAFADEARLAARIRHPNVVPTLDVVSTEGELLIVMEYVDGEALSALLRRSEGARAPLPVIVAIVSEMLHGLHSAHEAKSETGEPLEIVHRDVSPHNVLVGADGVARLVDFGIARASSKKREVTGEDDLKGKLAYMAPEQLRRDRVTRRTDVFAAGIVLWELLTGKRLFASETEASTMEKILVGWVKPPSAHAPDLPAALDEIALCALDAEPDNRFATAREMAVALEDAVRRALGREVGAWVEATAAESLAKRRALVARAEEQGSGEGSRLDGANASAPRAPATSITETAELPTTPRRAEYTKPVAPTATAEATAAVPAPTRTPRHIIVPESEPVTGPARPLVPEPVTGPAPLVRPPAPLAGIEAEATMTSWGEPIAQSYVELVAAPTRAPARSRVDRLAYGVFAAATLVTLAVGLSWSKIAPTPSAPPAFEPLPAPTPTPTISPAPTPEPAVTPAPSASAAPSPPAPPAPTPAPSTTALSTPVIRRPVVVTKPRPAAKAPCVAKVDPASGKTLYQGDCD